MNKQELIEYCESLKGDLNKFINAINVDKIIAKIEQLDEPQKPVVKKFVADWYEENKDCLNYSIWQYVYNWHDQEETEFKRWFACSKNSFETLIGMSHYGYEIEKEAKYTVKIKAVNQYLVKNPDEEFLGFLQSRLKSKFTRKELEDAGFGEVFNSPLFEVKEV